MHRSATIAGATLCAALCSTLHADPVQVFGGGLAINDGIAGFTVDVNADGVFDINFAYFGVSVNSVFAWDAIVRNPGGSGDTIFDVTDGTSLLVEYADGASIGAGVDDGAGSGWAAFEVFFDGTFGGEWLDQEIGFFGFSILQAGERHYGWAEIQVDNSADPGFGSLILTRIAYETEPNTPIAAGDTGADPGCNAADLAEPLGLLDLADVLAFATAFLALEDAADMDGNGLWDLADVLAFVNAFNAGCP